MATADATTIKTSGSDDFLPTFPGEDPLKHAGAAWLENAESALAKRSLLPVAYGDPPPALKTIIDYDLSGLPALDPDDRGTMRAAW